MYASGFRVEVQREVSEANLRAELATAQLPLMCYVASIPEATEVVQGFATTYGDPDESTRKDAVEKHRPWIDAAQAQSAGQSPEEFAQAL